jgi:hypothetical protein
MAKRSGEENIEDYLDSDPEVTAEDDLPSKPSTSKPKIKRRTTKCPSKLNDYTLNDSREVNGKILRSLCKYLSFISSGKVILKCSQTGDKFLAKIANIFNEDGENVYVEGITPGLSVIADVDGTSYPAEVVSLQGNCLQYFNT